jgi:hypothetical protein
MQVRNTFTIYAAIASTVYAAYQHTFDSSDTRSVAFSKLAVYQHTFELSKLAAYRITFDSSDTQFVL